MIPSIAVENHQKYKEINKHIIAYQTDVIINLKNTIHFLRMKEWASTYPDLYERFAHTPKATSFLIGGE